MQCRRLVYNQHLFDYLNKNVTLADNVGSVKTYWLYFTAAIKTIITLTPVKNKCKTL